MTDTDSEEMIPEYQAYCDICNHGSTWYPVVSSAKAWRDLHFDDQHPDNPMKKQNCRIKRRKAPADDVSDKGAVEL